jgi:hypothetical protein
MRAFPRQYNLKEEEVLYYSHIPKTAGMTFRTIVEDQFPCHEICPATLNEQILNVPMEDMPRFRLFRGHLGYTNIHTLVPGKRIINVNVLREPVARVISHYDYIRRTPTDPRYDSIKDISLEDFAEKLTLGKLGKNMQTYHVAKVARFHLADLTPEETLEVAKESLDQFAFVGILEKFQDSLFLLSYIFGWKPILNSRKENASKKSKTGSDLPEGTLELIREQTQLDQVLYQYALEIYEQRFTEMMADLTAKYGLVENPSLEQVTAALEQHSEQRYLELQIPPAHSLTYHFCKPLRGRGWQRREFPKPDLVYRWTGADTVSTLDLPLAKDQDLQIEFCVIKSLAADVLQSLTLEVGGQMIPLSVRYHYDATTILQGTLPKEVLQSASDRESPFTCLTFRVNRTLRPQEVYPDRLDNRLVGLAFTTIQTFPVNEVAQAGIASFLFNSTVWQDTVAFVEKYLQPGQTILAPTIFRDRFPDHISEYHSTLPGEIRNYSPDVIQSDFDWAILHKGMKQEMGSIFLRLLGYSPVYANEVFVVFYRKGKLPALSLTSEHVKPLFMGWVKAGVGDRLTPLVTRFKGKVKNRVSADDWQKIKDYGKAFKQE